jgi:hypothetical protein
MKRKAKVIFIIAACMLAITPSYSEDINPIVNEEAPNN